ncbi:hypothetical protein B5F40_10825 [Gordonibacter sp. An230]|uniref:F390 synthetase-related protein n=1 Tax=Gordonibacter sp. An230 TaxID=1965592 RepID=UPI000B36D58F|nr:F390 synthetase-related protein [Gordonibacter sp. An230]OUO89480.1 hypothetical protein B5F40_10825 [Gordonibacter sp. An230]
MLKTASVMLYYLKYRRRRDKGNRAAFDRWQRRQVRRCVRRAARSIPYYRGMGKLPVDELPTMDKSRFMDSFSSLNRVGVAEKEAIGFALEGERARSFSDKLGRVSVGLSSGTSGRRGAFLVSDRERFMWAGFVLARLVPGELLKGHRVAFFMRANSNLYQAVASKRLRFEFFDILKPLDAHVERLNELDPTILVGQPSVLLELARMRASGQVGIDPGRLVSIAEVLEPQDEKRILEAFDVPFVHQVYQCTEGCLAVTCDHGSLHMNEDVVSVERSYLDDRRFSPIITDFTRRTQPIIRYRLDDVLVENAEPCPCGSCFLRLERIEGRLDDALRFPAVGGGEIQVFPDIVRRCVLMAGEVSEYRVVQVPDGGLTVHASVGEDVRRSIRSEFERLADAQGFEMPSLEFADYKPHGGGKMRRVERRRADDSLSGEGSPTSVVNGSDRRTI